MVVLAFIAVLVALVLFLVAAFNVAARVNLTSLGLAFLTLAWIVQLCTHGATRIHF